MIVKIVCRTESFDDDNKLQYSTRSGMAVRDLVERSSISRQQDGNSNSVTCTITMQKSIEKIIIQRTTSWALLSLFLSLCRLAGHAGTYNLYRVRLRVKHKISQVEIWAISLLPK